MEAKTITGNKGGIGAEKGAHAKETPLGETIAKRTPAMLLAEGRLSPRQASILSREIAEGNVRAAEHMDSVYADAVDLYQLVKDLDRVSLYRLQKELHDYNDRTDILMRTYTLPSVLAGVVAGYMQITRDVLDRLEEQGNKDGVSRSGVFGEVWVMLFDLNKV